MNTKLSKRILSVFLAVVMIATMLPAFSLSASADETRDKFLFAYFTGQSGVGGEEVCFAVSEDGYNFEALNDNSPVLNNTPSICYTQGTPANVKAPSGCARDPFIINKRDESGNIDSGYYVLGTDLRVNGASSYDNTKLFVWDLDSITDADTVQPWNIETSGWYTNYYDDSKKRTMPSSGQIAWAPEAIWDVENNCYMMYYSGPDYNNSCNVLYVYTHDFQTFYQDGACTKEIGDTYAPNRLFGDLGWKNIDANLTYANGTYYAVFKSEDTGKKTKDYIYTATASHANGPYTTPVRFNNGVSCEGPEMYQLNNGNYIMMMDHFTDNGIFLMYENTIGNITPSNYISSSQINHLSPRHGAVAKITTTEYNALIQKFGVSHFATSALNDVKGAGNVNDHMVARYFTNATDIFDDATGHDFRINTNNGAEMTTQGGKTAVKLDSSDSLQVSTATLGSTIRTNKEFTLDWYGWETSTSRDDYSRFVEITPYGSQSITYPGDGKTYANGGYQHHFTYIAGNGVIGVDGNANEGIRGRYNSSWNRYTVSYSKGYVTLYINGQLVKTVYASNGTKSQTGTPWYETQIDDSFFNEIFGSNSYVRFGASIFNGDAFFNGYISDFRIYDKAMTFDCIEASDKEIRDALLGDTSGAKQVFGNVDIDPIIFTHGTNSNSNYSYMMKGKIIADGTVAGEAKTEFKLKNDSSYEEIKSIEFVESSVAATNVNVAKNTTATLSGELGSKYADVTDGEVTVKFIFAGGDYELHKLAVKTNPVAEHAVAAVYGSTSWNSYRSAVFYEVAAIGSYGVLGTESYSYSGSTSRNGELKKSNYASIYHPYDTNNKVSVSNYSKLTINGFSNNYDKVAGYYGFAGWDKNEFKDLIVTSPTAEYYLDISTNKNYGISNNGANYSINLLVGGLAHSCSELNDSNQTKMGKVYVSAIGTRTVGQDDFVDNVVGNSTMNVTQLAPNTIYMNGTNQSGENAVIGGVASVGTTTAVYRLGYIGGQSSWTKIRTFAQLNTNLKLVVSDKTDARNTYNSEIARAKTLKETCFTEESWNRYMNALLALEQYLNDNQETTDSKGTEAALIAAAVMGTSSGLVYREEFYHDVEFNRTTKEATCTVQSTDIHKCKFCNFETEKHDTAPLGHLDAGVTFVDNEDGTHNVMCNREATPHVKEADLPHKMTYTSNDDGTHNGECSICHGGVVTNEACTFEDNKCAKCGYEQQVELNWDAYNAAVSLANQSLVDPAYTQDSRDDLADVLDDNAKAGLTTQAAIDAATSAISTANQVGNGGVLVIASYTVTVHVMDAPDSELRTTVYTDVYGAAKEMTVPGAVRWEKGGKVIASSVERITHVISGNADIYAYIDNDAAPANTFKVTVLDRNNNAIGYMYLESDSSLTLGENGLVGTVQIPATPFYGLSGYTVNGETVAKGSAITVDADVAIKPEYSAIESIAIKLGNATDSQFNDGAETEKAVNWDEKIVIESKDGASHYWFVDGTVVSKGVSYTFRATKGMTVTVGDASDADSTGSSLITYAQFNAGTRQARIAASSYKSDAKLIKEQGIKLVTASSADATSDVATVISKGSKFKATLCTDTGDQFSFTLNVKDGSPVKKFFVVSYVIYEGSDAPVYDVSMKTINVQ